MANVNAEAFAGELFYSSGNSQLGKARRWLWLIALFSVAGAIAGARGSPLGMLFAGGLTLLTFVAIDAYFKGQLRDGQAVVAITDEWIESPVFSSAQKRFEWREISGVSLEATQGAPWLEFRLASTADRSDRKSFWTGRSEARPSLLLTRFSVDEQARLTAAIERQLNAAGSVAEGAASAVHSSVAEEAEFQERLRQMAPIPWMLWLIVGANVLIWALTAVYSGSILQNPADKLFAWGGNTASEVQRGEWWRLLSATFLHGGLMHVAMNMIGLVSAGVAVERIYGHRLFLLIYFGSGLLGSALSLHFSAQSSVSVGASGAVFGITGALLVAVFQHRENLPKAFGKQTISSLGVFIVYALMQGFAKQGIDNAAHIGGLIGGGLLAAILPERFDMAHYLRTYRTRLAAGLLLVVATAAAIAAIAPRAAVDHKRLFDSTGLITRGLNGFDAGIKGVRDDALAVQRGAMSEREADERSRRIHAPAFRAVLEDLDGVYLRPGDPRAEFIRDVRRMTELLFESLAMESVWQDGNDRPTPADPQRMAAIERELREVDARLKKFMEVAKAKPGSR